MINYFTGPVKSHLKCLNRCACLTGAVRSVARFFRNCLCALATTSVIGTASEITPANEDSEFQAALDYLGIPYTVPPGGKAILVNIPAFELIAFEDGMPVLRSKVIVGTPWNPSPLLQTVTQTVRFRPTWRPTPSMIARGEYRDKVWPPGPQNPLGLAAIRFATQIPVYLHDTNRRALFDLEMRALSHGCIRVERWDNLVAWTLNMELSEVHRLAHGQATIDVATPAIPVTIGYFLVFPDSAGAPVVHDDVYKRGEDKGSEDRNKSSEQYACGNMNEINVE